MTTDDDYVRLRDVRLAHPPEIVPPVLLGVRRPFGLRASGRSGDGTILVKPSPPAYIRSAREEIEQGRSAAGSSDPHEITVYVDGRIAPDRDQVRRLLAGLLLRDGLAAQLASLDGKPELPALREIGDAGEIAGQLPDDLVNEVAAAGTTDQVVASLSALVDAGADSIVFVPIGPDPDEQLNLLATEVVPSIRGAK